MSGGALPDKLPLGDDGGGELVGAEPRRLGNAQTIK
jgi:hypothetical protein